MKIRKIMTEPVRSCGLDTNLASVIDTMRTYDCGIVPVVNDGAEAVGVITDRDVCLALGARDDAPSRASSPSARAQPSATD